MNTELKTKVNIWRHSRRTVSVNLLYVQVSFEKKKTLRNWSGHCVNGSFYRFSTSTFPITSEAQRFQKNRKTYDFSDAWRSVNFTEKNDFLEVEKEVDNIAFLPVSYAHSTKCLVLL